MRGLATLIPHLLAILIYLIGLSHAAQHFEFESPSLLWLGALIVLNIGLRFYGQSNKGFTGLVWSWESPESRLTWKNMGFQCIPEIPYALRTLTIGMLTIAAARPQSSSSVEDLTREGIDIVLSMDLSASMLSKDFDPNRLEASKVVATNFVDDRPNDRIGVVAYEGEAFTQIPLTTDQRIVMNGISELRTGLLEGGTAIGMGLATAVNRLKTSEAESKVIILLTDGVNNAGKIEPLDAAQLAKLNDIRVYTIGVGTIGKARSPVAKVGNQFQYDWVEVEIDETVLRGIAKVTGGRYFRATNEEKLASIYTEIDELEKTRFNVLRYNQKTEEFLPFGIAAVLVFFLEFLLRQFAIRTLI
ncbi:MAG: aerotolerance regulator BatA [Crocinitomicaceae bacterium]|nr:aerotolerance regulator BatA [Crocinitomicaceae bacterium]|tara:strand:+ start:822 stop:1898 length:1077 start_codon:yes stop_codon:yes gene_type:complete